MSRKPEFPAKPPDRRIPVHCLSGFLGSGKTTLLRHFLADPELSDTAVLVNEFGEIGLDHLLVEDVADDVVLLESGCVCCSVRDDLASSLLTLEARAAQGEIPAFSRAVIETTGLADPLQIAELVMADARLAAKFRLGRLTTTLDGLYGLDTLRMHEVARKQVATADTVIITKTDIAEPQDEKALRAEIEILNPRAEIVISASHARPQAAGIFAERTIEGMVREVAAAPAGDGRDHQGHAHGDDIVTFVAEFGEVESWESFVDWLDLLLQVRGHTIYRVKGWVAVKGRERPVVIQGVQHTMFPPARLPQWPDGRRASRLVFIARDLERKAIEGSLAGIAEPAQQAAAGE